VTVAEQLRTQAGGVNWSAFAAPSLKTATASQASSPLAQAGAEILEQRVGFNVPGPYADQQQQTAPSKVPLYLALGLGAFAVIGFVVHLRRRS
jgi:hypothetical protein